MITNWLPIERIPDVIFLFQPKRFVPREELEEVKRAWAFREAADGVLLSFHYPPQSLVTDLQLRSAGMKPWRATTQIQGINTKNLISELVRKSILAKCTRMGLQYCNSTAMYYFPFGLVPSDHVRYRRADGLSAYINVVGERKYRRSMKGERYRYYLAPDFYVSQHLVEEYSVLVRTRVRITDSEGNVLSAKSANARRKDLCHDWWNHEWLNRMLAMCQFLAEDGKIICGDLQSQQLILAAEPIHLTSPKGIDEAALSKSSFEREELLVSEFDEDSDEGPVDDD